MIGATARRYTFLISTLILGACWPAMAAAPSVGTKSAPAKAASGEWLLAGREGACAPLSLLEKKGTEFRGIKSPNQLAEKMRAAGHKVEVKEYNLGSRPAVEVRVPARELYVMFVQAEFCGEKAPGNTATPKAQERGRKR